MDAFRPALSLRLGRLFILLIAGIAALGILACEGPAGPEGPQGEQGPQGDQGPQGPAGPDPDIINLDLTDHVQETTFDRGSKKLSSKDDTLEIQWGATMDTTITSVTIADSQYAEIYVRVPGLGFQRAPISFDFTGSLNVSNVSRTIDPFDQVEYDLLNQLPSPSRDSFFAAEAVGGADRRYYTAVTDQFDIHEAVVEPGEFTAMIRAYEAVDGSSYDSGIAEGFSDQLVPFDSDLTSASAGSYPNANSNGMVDYRQSTTDLSAIQDSVGTDLPLEEYRLQAFKEGGFGTVGRTDTWTANPQPGKVQVRATWSQDSIQVAGVIIGTNYGRDRTIYTEKIPLDVRIAIVSGGLAKKMQQGKHLPFSEIQEAVRR